MNNKVKKFLIGLVIIGLCLTGCATEASRVNANLSKEAGNFNITRRIIVMNARTDTVLFDLTGNFDISNNSSSELVVTCELEDGSYKKNYIYLNDWTCYVVEDLTGTNVSKYHYELNILPQTIIPFTVTSED